MMFFKIIILMMVLLGYSFFMKYRWNIRFEFAPAVVCAGISTIMFFAGILNILLPFVYIITLCGVILFFYSIIKMSDRVLYCKRDLIICGDRKSVV